jgi:hypothetical protein
MVRVFGSAFRSLTSLVVLVFALTAIYDTLQGAYHYNENHAPPIHYFEALKMITSENLLVVITAIIIVLGWLGLEIYFLRKESKESDARIMQGDYLMNY